MSAKEGILTTTHAMRERVVEIPFSDHGLSRRVDHIEIDGPEGMIAAEDGWLWVRTAHGGELARVDPETGSVARVDVRAAAPAAWRDRDASVIALARGDAGSVIALASVSAGRGFSYALIRFSAGGAPLGAVLCPDLDRARQIPQAITADGTGRVWVRFPADTWILSPEGARTRSLGVPGILAQNGFFVSSEGAPRLFDADGKVIGPIADIESPPGRLRLAGPRGLVYASGDPAVLPEAIRGQLVVLDVYRLDPERRTLARVDRIVWPELRIAAATDPIGDARDVESELMTKSLASGTDGALWILEHAPPLCVLHRFRLITRAEQAPQRFAKPADLSPAELAFYRADARERAAAAPSGGGKSPFAAAIERLDAARPERP